MYKLRCERMRMRDFERDVESQVRKFYDAEGWVTGKDNKTQEDRYFRDFSKSRGTYNERINRRTASHFDGLNGILLIAGSGDLPESHMLAAEKFEKVICVDISWRALEINKRKLGPKGEYQEISILDIPLRDQSVDAVLCAHVLYHIDRKNQEKAVRELIRVTKPQGRIVILYLNPNAPLNLIQRFLKFFWINKILGKAKLYIYSYSLSWWLQFGDLCTVRILPHDVMSTNQMRVLMPGNALGKRFFNWAAQFEDRNPKLAIRLWSYPTIVLEKFPKTDR